MIHTGDFNSDGKSDLVWRNSVTGEIVIWLMDGTSGNRWPRGVITIRLSTRLLPILPTRSVMWPTSI